MNPHYQQRQQLRQLNSNNKQQNNPTIYPNQPQSPLPPAIPSHQPPPSLTRIPAIQPSANQQIQTNKFSQPNNNQTQAASTNPAQSQSQSQSQQVQPPQIPVHSQSQPLATSSSDRRLAGLLSSIDELFHQLVEFLDPAHSQPGSAAGFEQRIIYFDAQCDNLFIYLNTLESNLAQEESTFLRHINQPQPLHHQQNSSVSPVSLLINDNLEKARLIRLAFDESMKRRGIKINRAAVPAMNSKAFQESTAAFRFPSLAQLAAAGSNKQQTIYSNPNNNSMQPNANLNNNSLITPQNPATQFSHQSTILSDFGDPGFSGTFFDSQFSEFDNSHDPFNNNFMNSSMDSSQPGTGLDPTWFNNGNQFQ